MIRPYNELWMDCVTNNVIAMLIAENEAFSKIPCYMDTIYLKKVYNQSYSSDEIQGELLENGLFFPKIQYSLDLLYSYIEQEFVTLSGDIHGAIKKRIDDGYTTFVLVDRYFYPSGVNANTSHMLHPTFIYNYDEESRCYLAIEDCVVMGTLDYYKIPYESIDLSCEYLKSIGKPVKIRYCKAKDSARNFEPDLQISYLMNSLNKMLQGGEVYNKDYDLYYHSGIDALTAFLNEHNHLFLNLKSEDLFRTRMLSFCQFHQRNQELMRLITEKFKIDTTQIESNYFELQKKWTIYKNRSNYLLEKKKIYGTDVDVNDVNKLKLILSELIEMERSTAENLLSTCKGLYMDV